MVLRVCVNMPVMLREGMCACVTFMLIDVHHERHSSHRCDTSAHLKAHHGPYLSLMCATVINTDGHDSNGNNGNSSFSNVQNGNTML